MTILGLIYIVPQVARIFFKQIQQDDLSKNRPIQRIPGSNPGGCKYGSRDLDLELPLATVRKLINLKKENS